ncbi:MAG: hypothetical protein Q8S73_15435 [Deltaproteobacteria bacterium]|nr:hypothetical protein [Myxococcales bacterium]MDP3215499.1 hypothetical protein [Deltaproteobacteria bacterium]
MTSLSPFIRALSESDDITFVLGADRRIVQFNEAWSRFALANGGGAGLQRWEGGGAPIDEAIPEVLRAFYVDAFARSLASGERWEHEYECSSAETYRRYRMVTYPVDGRFLVVVHSLVAELPHERAECAPTGAYAADGIIVLCSHCRRVRNPAGLRRWDWVPAYVRSPPENVSHGLCEPCYEFYWGTLPEDDDG